jgi:hypothetical protein
MALEARRSLGPLLGRDHLFSSGRSDHENRRLGREAKTGRFTCRRSMV